MGSMGKGGYCYGNNHDFVVTQRWILTFCSLMEENTSGYGNGWQRLADGTKGQKCLPLPTIR
jgi:hypothetical protein